MEYIQADIWVRFQKMRQHEVFFIGADDAHGAAIMLASEEAGMTPKAFVASITKDRQDYLQAFLIDFDHWYVTNTPENINLSQSIYRTLKTEGLVSTKAIEQFYDPVKDMFLPDRFIKGECPVCHAKDQYGDTCENCGKFNTPTDLINPYSVLSGIQPIRKSSLHYFFRLSDLRCIQFLQQWTSTPGRLQPEVLNKIREWLDHGTEKTLADWDISRDAPYYGIKIPDLPSGSPTKYFYVWLDAPIGYLASLKNYLDKKGIDFDHYIKDPVVEQYHFIGKDITYFHCLFWPAILHFSGRKTPDGIFVHGHLTVNGEKMSKSRKTGIDPIQYLKLGLDPEALRYYLATKLNSKSEDIDFNTTDFLARVNSDLIGKYINIASRLSGFLHKYFHNTLSESLKEEGFYLLDNISHKSEHIANLYENRDYAKVVREIMALADQVNIFIDHHKPWELAKDTQKHEHLHLVCSTGLEAFRLLSIYLKPILPRLVEKIETFLRVYPLYFSDTTSRLGQHTINKYQHLLMRIDSKILDNLLDHHYNKENMTTEHDTTTLQTPPVQQTTTHATIDMHDFAKVDLRIAKIVRCEAVAGSNKLLCLHLDIGEKDDQGEAKLKQVFSSIAKHYQPKDLINKLTVMVVNLQPRKMRFGISEGMVLAASHINREVDSGIYLLEPWPGAQPGMRVS
jgi:methionyl-tRNA synthetase